VVRGARARARRRGGLQRAVGQRLAVLEFGARGRRDAGRSDDEAAEGASRHCSEGRRRRQRRRGGDEQAQFDECHARLRQLKVLGRERLGRDAREWQI
jgi:hypothetical protein